MDRQFKNFIRDLVLENRHCDWDGEYYLSVNDLSSSEKQEFITHLLSEDSDYCGWMDSLIDDNGTIFKTLMSTLRKPDLDNKINFADTVIEQLCNYYGDKMQSMIDDILRYELAA